MPGLIKGNQFVRTAIGAPAIAVTYGIVAYSVIVTGCTPQLADVEFFGVRVTLFLLLALTVAALVLIIFALLNVLRVMRILRRRHRQVDLTASRWFGAIALTLGVSCFAVTAWLGLCFLAMRCG